MPFFPLPGHGFIGLHILDDQGKLLSKGQEVLDLVAEHGAVLATGHISAREALVVLEQAVERKIDRLLNSLIYIHESLPDLIIAY